MNIRVRNGINKFICVCFIISIINNCFCACSYKNNNMNEHKDTVDKLNLTKFDDVLEKIKAEQHPFFTKLIYISNDKVILNGNVGLIVYDLKNRKIVRAVDLSDIHMNLIQGDDVTIFKVSEYGDKVLMYNDIFQYKHMDNGDFTKTEKKDLEGQYLYDVEDDTLIKTDIDKLEYKYNIRKFDIENNDDRDREYIDCAYLDEKNMCYIATPKDSDLMSELQIIILNNETDEEEIYNVF